MARVVPETILYARLASHAPDSPVLAPIKNWVVNIDPEEDMVFLGVYRGRDLYYDAGFKEVMARFGGEEQEYTAYGVDMQEDIDFLFSRRDPAGLAMAECYRRYILSIQGAKLIEMEREKRESER